MLGQTGVKDSGNLADLSPFGADSSGKGLNLSVSLGGAQSSVAPCPGSVLHWSRDQPAPSRAGSAGWQAQTLQQGQLLDAFK